MYTELGSLHERLYTQILEELDERGLIINDDHKEVIC